MYVFYLSFNVWFENTVGKGENAYNKPFRELPAIYMTAEIVVCKLFQFGRV